MQKSGWAYATHYNFFLLFHQLAKIGKVGSWQQAVSKFPLIIVICRLPNAPDNKRDQLLTIGYICNMEVNDVLVDKLANLARLKFDASEKESIKNDLQKMIQFVEKLNELDTTGVEPLLHMSNNVNVLRADEVKGSISREAGLQNAAIHDDQFFKVPKVIKKIV